MNIKENLYTLLVEYIFKDLFLFILMKYTILISAVIVLFFLMQILIPGFTETFVLNQDSFSQPWRFVTSIFLHGGAGHLLYNLFALILFGFILEKIIGSKGFLIVFFSSGIIANLISINFYESSLGASGAIMGIIGVLAVIKPLMMVWAFGMIVPMFIAAILWIVGDIFGIFFPSNVGNIAHLSGIAFGIIFGMYLLLKRKKIKQEKIKISEDSINSWENYYLK